QAVIITAFGISLIAGADLYAANETTVYGAFSFLAILVAGFLSTIYALNRQRMQQRIHQQQTVIDTVARLRQPLAVIFGYTQFLERHPVEAPTVERALGAIKRAAVTLRDMLDDVMARWGAQ